MKISKDDQRVARKLLEACTASGKLDLNLVRGIVNRLSTTKPRGYLSAINAFWRLVKLEASKNQAEVESAVSLDATMQMKVLSDLKSKYGDQIEANFRVNPDLIGGMRIRVGSDVWDGSVKNRIERLEDKFT